MFGKAYNALKVICNTKFVPLISPHSCMDLFRIFRDGGPLEGLPSPIKKSPKIASAVPPILRTKLGLLVLSKMRLWD